MVVPTPALHHVVSNFDYQLQNDFAKVECHVYACHHANHIESWDVFGRYLFELLNIESEWLISSMTLIVHGQKGNRDFLRQLSEEK